MPIYEPGLEELVHRNVADGRLSFTTELEPAVRRSDIVFIAVGTPPKASGESDLSAVEEVALGIARAIDRYKVIVNKSTVPVGTGDLVRDIIQRNRRRPIDFDVVSNPEFLREGSAVHDFLHPDRVVIGADDQSAAIRVSELYDSIDAPVIVTDPPTAEAIKYASNAFLATKVSFVNAMAAVCEAVGADVRDVVLGMGYDKRIGFEFLRPGPGWGGSCFPKDSRALVHIAEEAGYDFALLKGVIAVNEEQFHRIAEKVVHVAGGSVEGVAVGAWGLTFKARTDDLRDSPAIEILQRLRSAGAQIRAFDPSGPAPDRPELEGIEVVDDPYAAAAGASVLVVLTEWDDFRWLDLDKVREVMAGTAVVDARNLLDPAALRRKGFTYEGVGR
jgi:UDPglucose 6-dehydrogenase